MKFEVGFSAIFVMGWIFYRNLTNPAESFESQTISTFLVALGIVVIFFLSVVCLLYTSDAADDTP